MLQSIGTPVWVSGAVPMPPIGGMVLPPVLLALRIRPVDVVEVTPPQIGASWMVGTGWSQRPLLGSSTLICVPTSQARLPAALAPPRPSPWQAQLHLPT